MNEQEKNNKIIMSNYDAEHNIRFDNCTQGGQSMKLIKSDAGKWYFEINVVGYGYYMSVDYVTEGDACRAAHANKIVWIEPGPIWDEEDVMNGQRRV